MDRWPWAQVQDIITNARIRPNVAWPVTGESDTLFSNLKTLTGSDASHSRTHWLNMYNFSDASIVASEKDASGLPINESIPEEWLRPLLPPCCEHLCRSPSPLLLPEEIAMLTWILKACYRLAGQSLKEFIYNHTKRFKNEKKPKSQTTTTWLPVKQTNISDIWVQTDRKWLLKFDFNSTTKTFLVYPILHKLFHSKCLKSWTQRWPLSIQFPRLAIGSR